MIVVFDGRQRGKTTKIVDWWVGAPERRVVVVATEQEATRVRSGAIRCLEERGLAPTRYGPEAEKVGSREWARWATRAAEDGIVSIATVKAARWRSGVDVEYGIDDLEAFLSVVLHGRVGFVTGLGPGIAFETDWTRRERLPAATSEAIETLGPEVDRRMIERPPFEEGRRTGPRFDRPGPIGGPIR